MDDNDAENNEGGGGDDIPPERGGTVSGSGLLPGDVGLGPPPPPPRPQGGHSGSAPYPGNSTPTVAWAPTPPSSGIPDARHPTPMVGGTFTPPPTGIPDAPPHPAPNVAGGPTPPTTTGTPDAPSYPTPMVGGTSRPSATGTPDAPPHPAPNVEGGPTPPTTGTPDAPSYPTPMDGSSAVPPVTNQILSGIGNEIHAGLDADAGNPEYGVSPSEDLGYGMSMSPSEVLPDGTQITATTPLATAGPSQTVGGAESRLKEQTSDAGSSPPSPPPLADTQFVANAPDDQPPSLLDEVERVIDDFGHDVTVVIDDL
jgi:hypothetical protein